MAEASPAAAAAPEGDAEAASGPAVEFHTTNITPVWDLGEVVWAKLEGYPWWPSQVRALGAPSGNGVDVM